MQTQISNSEGSIDQGTKSPHVFVVMFFEHHRYRDPIVIDGTWEDVERYCNANIVNLYEVHYGKGKLFCVEHPDYFSDIKRSLRFKNGYSDVPIGWVMRTPVLIP